MSTQEVVNLIILLLALALYVLTIVVSFVFPSRVETAPPAGQKTEDCQTCDRNRKIKNSMYFIAGTNFVMPGLGFLNIVIWAITVPLKNQNTAT